MRDKAWIVMGACVSGLALPGAAEACGGGGIVSSQPGSVGADAQRVLIAVHDDGVGATTTEIVTVIDVPATTADYGALLPLPSEPTLDPMPVSTEEFDRLDAETAPQIRQYDDSDDSGSSGCGCLAAGAYGGDVKGAPVRVSVSAPVTIGPVTAVVLTGTTDAVNTWLGENGFAISEVNQALITDYAGYYFVAIRRNDTAAPGGPTSIGVHFSMAGDHRELPLRFASLGAAPTVAFTLFLATNDTVGPSAPFAPLTLTDLDPGNVRAHGYRAAVEAAVAGHAHQAFVLESRTPRDELPALDGTRLGSLIWPRTAVTRMTTVLPAEALTEDAHFYDSYDGDVPRERTLVVREVLGAREASLGSLALLALAGLRRRRSERDARGRDASG